MQDKIIDGRAIAAEYLAATAAELQEFKQQYSITPKLTVVLVGEDAASQVYVGNKIKTCAKLGLHSHLEKLPSSTSQQELLRLIDTLNRDAGNHGILVQLPLPAHIDSGAIINAINPNKDVDGFHPQNIAALYLNDTANSLIPCTPLGCYKLLQHIGFETEGAHAVIVGRSNIVGKPLAMLLLLKGHASVTMLHSKSKDPHKIARQADLIVSAVGVANLITPEWVKPGAVVIDVGMNRIESAQATSGYKLVGDANLPALLPLVSKITPVPGGVGPMTIAMLMANCLKAAKINLTASAPAKSIGATA